MKEIEQLEDQSFEEELNNQLISILDSNEIDEEIAGSILKKTLDESTSLDISILHNIGLLSARISCLDYAYSIARLSTKTGELATASSIVFEVQEYNSQESEFDFKSILNEVVSRGHVTTKCDLFSKRMSRFGMLGKLAGLIYRVIHFPKVFVIALRNPSDERISSIPGLVQRSQKA